MGGNGAFGVDYGIPMSFVALSITDSQPIKDTHDLCVFWFTPKWSELMVKQAYTPTRVPT